MRPAERPDCPPFLEENWQKWGAEYAAKRRDNPSHRFHWKSWHKTPVNQLLLGPLSGMTDDHCAYCDWYPTDCGTDRTIDHFKPKTQFPNEAYHWPNLYLSCRQCQSRGIQSLSEEQYAQVLRPDTPGYRFERYFIYQYRNGNIAPNPAATPSDRSRAELTIRVFQLNAGGRPAARRRMLAKFERMDEPSREEFRQTEPFRYLLPVE
jgi:uncharacterized protein (TIGR02646 family)